MESDFDKISAMLNGEQLDSYYKSQLSATDKTQIDNAIEILFSGLSLDKWLNGGKLMDAWKESLDVVRDTIFGVITKNPAVLYAHQAAFDHRKKWHVKIIYSPHGNETINCTPDKRNEWQENANQKIQTGLNMLRKKFSEFESGTVRKPKESPVPQQTIEMTKILTIGEREHERVRERDK